MTHIERNVGRVVVLSLLSAVSACVAAPAPTTIDESVGGLEFAVASAAESANQYRLLHATFSVTGPAPSSDELTISSDDHAPSDSSLRTPLREGDYAITLLPGWSLHRLDADNATWIEVSAALAHDTIAITIAKGFTSQARFAFEVAGGMLDLGEGEIVIDVTETGACPDGYTACGAGCVDISSNRNHCGGCGHACDFAQGSGVCDEGQCVLSTCQGPFGDCDADPINGCEMDTSQSPFHCGACGNQCPTGRACVDSVCVGPVCSPGKADCDGGGFNGCETRLATSHDHCGACGNRCADNEACVSGVCEPTP